MEDEMRQSYLDYAMSVIIGRALPDVRDGLKPVHRRILFAMNELRTRHNRAYKKSRARRRRRARQVPPARRHRGLRRARAHGAGLLAALPADRRAGQLRLGRRRSAGGHALHRSAAWRASPASCSPTSTRRRSTSCPTTTTREQEPLVLPSQVPATCSSTARPASPSAWRRTSRRTTCARSSTPPSRSSTTRDDHARRSDAAHARARTSRPAASSCGRAGISRPTPPAAARIVHARARRTSRPARRTTASTIIVTEIPYQVNKARLHREDRRAGARQALEGISDVRDESDREGMRIVIELEARRVPEVVLNQLFKHTALQTSFGVIMLAIVNGQPQVLDLKEMLGSFIAHRREVVTRRVALRAAQGPRALQRAARLALRARQHRSHHHHHPWLEGRGRGQGRAARREVRRTRSRSTVLKAIAERAHRCTRSKPATPAQRAQVASDPGDAPATLRRPRARQDLARGQEVARRHRLPHGRSWARTRSS